jgi:hypothetical protein
MRFALLAIMGIVVSSSLLAEEKPDPRENLDTAIPEALRLIEKKDYEGLLKAFVAPKELEMIVGTKPLAGFAQKFGEHKAAGLETALKEAKSITPTFNEAKDEATFQFKEPLNGQPGIKFQKVDKYWYIKN